MALDGNHLEKLLCMEVLPNKSYGGGRGLRFPFPKGPKPK